MPRANLLRRIDDVVRSRVVRTPWPVILCVYLFLFALGVMVFAASYRAPHVSFFGSQPPANSADCTPRDHLSWSDAFYFSIVTQTTLGYGDIVPGSGAGKLLVGLQVFVFGLLLNGFLLGIVVSKLMFHTPLLVFSSILTHQNGDRLQFRFYFDHSVPVLNITVYCYLRLTPYPLGSETRPIIQTRIVKDLEKSYEPFMETRAPIFIEVKLPTTSKIAELRESMYQARPGEAPAPIKMRSDVLPVGLSGSPITSPPLSPPRAAFEELKEYDDLAVLVSGTRSDSGESIAGSKVYQFRNPDRLLVKGSFRNIEIEFIEDHRQNSRLIKHHLLDAVN